MAQYIDKDALVAEIERRRDLHYKYYVKNGIGSIAECKYDEDRDILSFLDTLEVKRVDLMIHTTIAECCDWLAMNTNLSHDKIESCRNLMLSVNNL